MRRYDATKRQTWYDVTNINSFIMDNSLKQTKQITWNNVLVHILLWGVIFILPYFFMDTERVFNWRPFIRSIPEMVGFMLVFYINHFILIEKLLFKGKTKEFIIY